MIISSVIMISFVAFAPQESAKTYVNVITASAADLMTKPVLIKRQAYSNKIEAGVKNLTSFSSKTTFEVYVNGRYVRKYTWQALKKDNYIKPMTASFILKLPQNIKSPSKR